MTSIDDRKAALRTSALAARRAAFARADAGERADAVAATGLQIAGQHGARSVSAYLPIKGELDTGPLITALHGAGVTIALPVVVGAGQALELRAWAPGEPLEKRAFGIPEPIERTLISPDLLFVPLVAFDATCYRLGYGGGFYDRTLAALAQARGKQPPAYGIAFREQYVEDLPHGPHDMQLSGVITPEGLRQPSRVDGQDMN